MFVAFAVNVCQTLLNPRSETIQIKEEVLKRRLKKNMVYIIAYLNNYGYLH
jgi:hypothetical protein